MARISNWVQATDRVLIRRPLDYVFDFVSDPLNDELWMGAGIKVEKLTSGPVAAGAVFRHSATLFKRRLVAEWKIVEYFPNLGMHCVSVNVPPRFEGGYRFDDKHGGTEVTKYASFNRTFAPPLVPRFMMDSLFKAELRASLCRLKLVLEDS